jgi:hypothetical protein
VAARRGTVIPAELDNTGLHQMWRRVTVERREIEELLRNFGCYVYQTPAGSTVAWQLAFEYPAGSGHQLTMTAPHPPEQGAMVSSTVLIDEVGRGAFTKRNRKRRLSPT